MSAESTYKHVIARAVDSVHDGRHSRVGRNLLLPCFAQRRKWILKLEDRSCVLWR